MSSKGLLDFELLRSLTFKALKSHMRDEHIYVTIVIDDVDRTALEMGLLKGAQPYRTTTHSNDMYMPLADREKIRLIIWQMILQGIVAPGGSEGSPNFGAVKVTEYGKEVLESGEILPYDPEGFIRHLKDSIPTIDDIIMVYVEEALRSFMGGSYLASAVMLGVASERGILLLIDQYASAISDAQSKSKFEKEMDEARAIMKKFEIFRKHIEPLKKTLRQKVSDDLDIQLDGIFNSIRVSRNDAGHPTGRKLVRTDAYAVLSLFPNYIVTLYKLIDYFLKNKV